MMSRGPDGQIIMDGYGLHFEKQGGEVSDSDMDGKSHVRINGDGWVEDGRMVGLVDGWMDGWMERWMD